MIVCKVCGTENEQGAGFCGSCGSFLEWNSEAAVPESPAAPPAGPTGPATPTPPAATPAPPAAVPAPAFAAPTTAASTAPVPAPPEPVPSGSIICPACGQPNEPTRVFCRRCATELAPVSVATTPVPVEAPRARSVPPVAILGGIAGIVLLGALAAFVLLPKGTGPSGPAASPSPSASAAPGPSASGDAGGTGGSPSAPSSAPSAEPTPAPLTGLVVFSAVKDGDADLWIWDPADGTVRRLLKAPGGQTDPAWSPDGSKIVYRDPSGLRIVTVDGKPADPPDFTHHAQDRHPAWSPDGTTIVFSTNRTPYTSLNLVTRPAADNQANLTLLVGSKGDDWDPQWSPDGSRIVFVSRRLGDSHLFLMNSDGTDQAEVPLGKGIFDDPMFSPDGLWLSFTRRDSAATPKALYVARVDGTEMRRLTHSDANENDMAWSPDGSDIAVARADAAGKIVLIEVATGREVTTFGVDGAKNQVPDWWWPRP